MKRMTSTEIEAAIIAFEATVDAKSPTYKRRRTMSLDLRRDPWPNVSVKDQILAFLTKYYQDGDEPPDLQIEA